MKHMNRPPENLVARTTTLGGCLRACRKMLARLQQVKAAIFAESRSAFTHQERLLRLALNEAEALAWQTTYPHLVFPALATEKVQAMTAWSERQAAVRRNSSVAWLAD